MIKVVETFKLVQAGWTRPSDDPINRRKRKINGLSVNPFFPWSKEQTNNNVDANFLSKKGHKNSAQQIFDQQIRK